MDSPTLISGLVTISVGAISGGITNAVAIWMLFHPYQSRGIGPLRIQGAIPKNKARLAKSIGKTVGEKLLTAEDLSRRLAAPEVRAGFDAALTGFLDNLLEQERGPLLDQLPPDLAVQIEGGLDRLAARAAEQLADYAGTPAFEAMVATWLDRLHAEVGDRPIGELLTPDRRASLQTTVERWLHDLTEGPELEAAVRHFVEVQLERLGKDDRPLIDRLPVGLVGTVEQAIHDYLPVAIERLGAVLSDPEAKSKIHQTLRATFDRSVRDLLLHERLLARIVVTDQTFTRLLDGLEREGFERFAESLTGPDMRAQLTRAINDGLVHFLRIPLSERLARMGPEKRAALAGTLGDWGIAIVRDETTRQVAGRAVDRLLAATESRTWNDLLGAVPPERVTQFLAEAFAAERGRKWVEEAVRSTARAVLARPLGRPARLLGAETTTAVRASIINAAWEWTQRQIPRVVEQFNVQEMVEQKVLGFSTERMEQIIRGVTQRELTLIVQLGYVLGAIVGIAAFGVGLLFR